MVYAVVDNQGKAKLAANASVENIITLDEAQREDMERALGKLIIPAGELGLSIGDLFNGNNWTRNIDGVQVALPIETEDSAVDEYIAIMEGRLP